MPPFVPQFVTNFMTDFVILFFVATHIVEEFVTTTFPKVYTFGEPYQEDLDNILLNKTGVNQKNLRLTHSSKPKPENFLY